MININGNVFFSECIFWLDDVVWTGCLVYEEWGSPTFLLTLSIGTAIAEEEIPLSVADCYEIFN